MATPRSVMMLLAGLSGVFHKTVPKFSAEVHTTIGGCLPAPRLLRDAKKRTKWCCIPIDSSCSLTDKVQPVSANSWWSTNRR